MSEWMLNANNVHIVDAAIWPASKFFLKEATRIVSTPRLTRPLFLGRMIRLAAEAYSSALLVRSCFEQFPRWYREWSWMIDIYLSSEIRKYDKRRQARIYPHRCAGAMKLVEPLIAPVRDRTLHHLQGADFHQNAKSLFGFFPTFKLIHLAKQFESPSYWFAYSLRENPGRVPDRSNDENRRRDQ